MVLATFRFWIILCFLFGSANAQKVCYVNSTNTIPDYISDTTGNLSANHYYQHIPFTNGDYDGDGTIDMVFGYHYQQHAGLIAYLGDKKKGYVDAKSSIYTHENAIFYLQSADFNNDGKLDVAASDNNGGISILLGYGDGRFYSYSFIDLSSSTSQNYNSIINDHTCNYCIPMLVGDINKDGNIDIIGDYGYAKFVLFGDGKGNLNLNAVVTIPIQSTETLTADFNNDGFSDLLECNYGAGNTIHVFFGDQRGNLNIEKITKYNQDGFAIVSDLTTTDFNLDNKLDIAFIYFHRPQGGGFEKGIHVMLGNGDGSFNSDTSFVVNDYVPYIIKSSDLNCDKIPDLAVGHIGSNFEDTQEFSVYLTKPNAKGFYPTEHINLNQSTSIFRGINLVKDINGDGSTDIAVVNWTDFTNTPVLSNYFLTLNVAYNQTTCMSSSAVTICDGQFTTLKAGVSGLGNTNTYTWIPSGVQSDTLVAFKAGTYAFKATSGNGCISYDSIQLNVLTAPIVHIGEDTTLCENQKIQLNA